MTFSVAFWNVVGSLNTDIMLRYGGETGKQQGEREVGPDQSQTNRSSAKDEAGVCALGVGVGSGRGEESLNIKGHRRLFGVLEASFMTIMSSFTKHFTS